MSECLTVLRLTEVQFIINSWDGNRPTRSKGFIQRAWVQVLPLQTTETNSADNLSKKTKNKQTKEALGIGAGGALSALGARSCLPLALFPFLLSVP